jgi:hypothetical protein
MVSTELARTVLELPPEERLELRAVWLKASSRLTR